MVAPAAAKAKASEAPSWEGLFAELEGLRVVERCYPYEYSDLTIIKLYVYCAIKRLTGFKTIQRHLELRADVVRLVGLEGIPHRKTLAVRFRAISTEVLGLIHQLTQRFIELKVVDPSIASLDSTLMQANGNLWHKKQMEAGELPKCGNIDTQAHWGVSGCGEWVFGYRLHCLTLCGVEGEGGGITWPATVSVHSANIKDAQVFEDELSKQLPKTTRVALGDGGYAQEGCFTICDLNQTSLVAPIKVKKTPHPNASSRLCSTSIPTSARSSPSEKPPSSPSRASSRSASASNACPSRVWPTSARSASSPPSPTSF